MENKKVKVTIEHKGETNVIECDGVCAICQNMGLDEPDTVAKMGMLRMQGVFAMLVDDMDISKAAEAVLLGAVAGAMIVEDRRHGDRSIG